MASLSSKTFIVISFILLDFILHAPSARSDEDVQQPTDDPNTAAFEDLFRQLHRVSVKENEDQALDLAQKLIRAVDRSDANSDYKEVARVRAYKVAEQIFQDRLHRHSRSFEYGRAQLDGLLSLPPVQENRTRVMELVQRYATGTVRRAQQLQKLDKPLDAIKVLQITLEKFVTNKWAGIGLDQQRGEMLLLLSQLQLNTGRLGDVVSTVTHAIHYLPSSADGLSPEWYLRLADALSGAQAWRSLRTVLARCLVKCRFKSEQQELAVNVRLSVALELLNLSNAHEVAEELKDQYGEAAFQAEKQRFHHSFKRAASQLRDADNKAQLSSSSVWSSPATMESLLPAVEYWEIPVRNMLTNTWNASASAVHRLADPLGLSLQEAAAQQTSRLLDADIDWMDSPLLSRSSSFEKPTDALTSEVIVPPLYCSMLVEAHASFCKLQAQLRAQRTHHGILQQKISLNDFPTWDFQSPMYGELKSTRRMRVGLYTSDLQNVGHPMVQLIQAFVNFRPTALIDLVVFAVKPDRTLFNMLQRSVAIHDLTELSDLEAAHFIFDETVMVLVDTSGRTGPHARPGVIAQKPAPVVCAWGGFPGTSGDPAVDYILTDPHTSPLSLSSLYSERLLQVPGSWLLNRHVEQYEPSMVLKANDYQKRSRRRAALGLPGPEAVVYASFNRMIKVDREAFFAWCTIVRRVPESVLVLLDAGEDGSPLSYRARRNVQHWWTSASHCGLDIERLIWLPRQRPGAGAHISAWACADIALDTPAYNGGMTTVDALYAGVPVLTTSGSRSTSGKFTQRMGAGILYAAGLSDCVLPDLQSYVDMAVQLGRNATMLSGLRERTAHAGHAFRSSGRGKPSSLFDTAQTAEYVAVGLRTAYTLWHQNPQGLPRDAHVLAPSVVEATVSGNRSETTSEEAAAPISVEWVDLDELERDWFN